MPNKEIVNDMKWDLKLGSRVFHSVIISLDYIHAGIRNRRGWCDGVVEHIHSRIIKHLRIAFCFLLLWIICSDCCVDIFLYSSKQISQFKVQVVQHALLELV